MFQPFQLQLVFLGHAVGCAPTHAIFSKQLPTSYAKHPAGAVGVTAWAQTLKGVSVG